MSIHHYNHQSLLLRLIIILITFSSAATETPPPSASPESQQRTELRRSPPSVPPPAPAEEQFNRIIDALIGAGDFNNWAGLISDAVIPLSATIFVPENTAVSGDNFSVPYHVIPQRLTFPELLQFRTNARLPTLLPGKTVVITNCSRQNFTIDGSPITVPDLYSTATFAVHGVGTIFDYSVYGDDLHALPSPGAGSRPVSDQSELFLSPPADGGFSGLSSDAAPPCLCNEMPVLFLAVCVVLGLKIHWNSFRSCCFLLS